MAFLTKQNIVALDVNGESHAHEAGTVLSDWELSDFTREKIKEGSQHYRERFEPLTEHEAHSHRVKATLSQGVRQLDGEKVDAPFDDYVGLHPTEVCDRLRDASIQVVEQTRKFERAGLARPQIVNYVSPAEREPWEGFNEASVTEVLAKFAVSSDAFVSDAVAYERVHKDREAVVGYDREVYEHATTPTVPPKVTAPQPSQATA